MSKDYSYEVSFSLEQNRWVAKFTANRFPISYSFPLLDNGQYHTPGYGQPAVRQLDGQEEAVLGLVFSQMMSLILEATARQAAARDLLPPPSPTEKALA